MTETVGHQPTGRNKGATQSKGHLGVDCVSLQSTPIPTTSTTAAPTTTAAKAVATTPAFTG
jgi:hypothetical protein